MLSTVANTPRLLRDRYTLLGTQPQRTRTQHLHVLEIVSVSDSGRVVLIVAFSSSASDDS